MSPPWSSMNSPKLQSSLSPTGRSRLTGWRPMSSTRRTSSTLMPAAGRFFCCRLSAQFLQEPLGSIFQLAEHVDHVDRNADRAGLVGNRPGDRLANPPGGVGRELEAAAVLVLVDRPHQAGVALLDQVQEAQAAVAVLLGDRDHQPQVAAGELPLDLFVLAELLPHVGSQRRRRLAGAFQREQHQVAQFLPQIGPLVLAGLSPAVRGDARSIHPSIRDHTPRAAASAAGRDGSAGSAPRPALRHLRRRRRNRRRAAPCFRSGRGVLAAISCGSPRGSVPAGGPASAGCAACGPESALWSDARSARP